MHTCLLVIDAQESFRHRPYWNAALAASYLTEQNTLIKEAVARNIPIVRILHSDGPEVLDNPFAMTSGLVRPLEGLQDFAAAAAFIKHRHSALVDTGLTEWLTENHMHRLIISGIRTEQCCETTARHASDLGWTVDYVLDATLTFDMIQPDGKPLCAADIKMRTATVLEGRFARICSVAQALSA
ncbi:MAG: isochorismatase family protein [Brachymonas sp.]|uniref:isochorismatase family protein n=1 Tax=Brachymonas sp. TaxID=1936292 RepID=UPI0035B49348